MEITEKLPEFWAHVKDNQRTDLKLNNPGSPLTKYFTLLYDPRYEVWYYVYELTIDRCLLERTEGISTSTPARRRHLINVSTPTIVIETVLW